MKIGSPLAHVRGFFAADGEGNTARKTTPD